MAQNEPKIEALFHRLRAEGFTLGPSDLVDLYRAIGLGFGLGTLGALFQCASALWVRSSPQRALFRRLFEETVGPINADGHEVTQGGAGARESSDAILHFADDVWDPKPQPGAFQVETGASLNSAESGRMRDEDRHASSRLSSSAEVALAYTSQHSEFSIGWPILRRDITRLLVAHSRHSSDSLREIALKATVDDVARSGFFLHPIFRPRQQRLELIVLIDASEAMAAYSKLTQQVIDGLADAGSALGHRVFWFRQAPSPYVYEDPYLRQSVEVDRVLQVAQRNGARVLIVGEAGAAQARDGADWRGQLKEFQRVLRKRRVPHAWVNPCPRARWQETAMEYVAQLGIPSFELTERDFAAALGVLTGESPPAAELTSKALDKPAVETPKDPVKRWFVGLNAGEQRLAMHLAVPLLLTTDLAYLIWSHFQSDEVGEPLNIHWYSVPDLLQLPFCRTVSRGVFQVNRAVRQFLIEQLGITDGLGPNRLLAVAKLLKGVADRETQDERISVRKRGDSQSLMADAVLAPHESRQRLQRELDRQDMQPARFAWLSSVALDTLIRKDDEHYREEIEALRARRAGKVAEPEGSSGESDGARDDAGELTPSSLRVSIVADVLLLGALRSAFVESLGLDAAREPNESPPEQDWQGTVGGIQVDISFLDAEPQERGHDTSTPDLAIWVCAREHESPDDDDDASARVRRPVQEVELVESLFPYGSHPSGSNSTRTVFVPGHYSRERATLESAGVHVLSVDPGYTITAAHVREALEQLSQCSEVLIIQANDEAIIPESDRSLTEVVFRAAQRMELPINCFLREEEASAPPFNEYTQGLRRRLQQVEGVSSFGDWDTLNGRLKKLYGKPAPASPASAGVFVHSSWRVLDAMQKARSGLRLSSRPWLACSYTDEDFQKGIVRERFDALQSAREARHFLALCLRAHHEADCVEVARSVGRLIEDSLSWRPPDDWSRPVAYLPSPPISDGGVEVSAEGVQGSEGLMVIQTPSPVRNGLTALLYAHQRDLPVRDRIWIRWGNPRMRSFDIESVLRESGFDRSLTNELLTDQFFDWMRSPRNALAIFDDVVEVDELNEQLSRLVEGEREQPLQAIVTSSYRFTSDAEPSQTGAADESSDAGVSHEGDESQPQPVDDQESPDVDDEEHSDPFAVDATRQITDELLRTLDAPEVIAVWGDSASAKSRFLKELESVLNARGVYQVHVKNAEDGDPDQLLTEVHRKTNTDALNVVLVDRVELSHSPSKLVELLADYSKKRSAIVIFTATQVMQKTKDMAGIVSLVDRSFSLPPHDESSREESPQQGSTHEREARIPTREEILAEYDENTLRQLARREMENLRRLVERLADEWKTEVFEAEYFFLCRLGSDYRDSYSFNWEPFCDFAGPLIARPHSLPVIMVSSGESLEMPRVHDPDSVAQEYVLIEVSPHCAVRDIADAWLRSLSRQAAIPLQGGERFYKWFFSGLGFKPDELSDDARAFVNMFPDDERSDGSSLAN